MSHHRTRTPREGGDAVSPSELSVVADYLRERFDEATAARMMRAVDPNYLARIVVEFRDACWRYGAGEGMADYASDVAYHAKDYFSPWLAQQLGAKVGEDDRSQRATPAAD